MPASVDPAYAREIGRQIAALRRARGLTQTDLGQRIGNSKNAVSNWERGASAPTVQNLRELCQALGTSPQTLLHMDGDGHAPAEDAQIDGRDLLKALSRARKQAEKAVPDLLTALRSAEESARRVIDAKRSG